MHENFKILNGRLSGDLGNGEFNHLIIILTILIKLGSKLSLNNGT